jgi:hypothetical protein
LLIESITEGHYCPTTYTWATLLFYLLYAALLIFTLPIR